MILRKSCKMKDKEMIEEMAKDFKSYLPSAWYNDKCVNGEVYSMVKHAYEDNYRKLPKDSVMLSREEYNALLLEQKRLKEMVDRISCGYALEKETAKKIFTKIFEDFNIDCGTFSINMSRKKYMNAQLEQTVTALRKRFLQLAKQFGVEIKEN